MKFLTICPVCKKRSLFIRKISFLGVRGLPKGTVTTSKLEMCWRCGKNIKSMVKYM